MSQPVEAPTSMSLADLAAVAWRRRWLCTGVGLAVCIGLFVGLMRQTPLFEAKAKLAVDRGRKAVEFQNDPESGRIEFSLLNTQRDMLQSEVALKAALTAAGADSRPPYSTAREPTEALRQRMKVATSRDSWVIQVSVRDESPQGAMTLLQATIDSYLAQQMRMKGQRAEGALGFLSTQVASARERLEAARAAEQEFRSQRNIIDSDPDKNLMTERLVELARQRSLLDNALAEAEAAQQQVVAARASSSARSRSLRASAAARSNSARASDCRPSLPSRSPRTLGNRW